jgi:8-oxo-dGTP diphosphatase
MAGREYPERPLVGIGVVLLQGNRVLLIRRGRPPSMGEWALPGGAQRVGETAEHAARRELAEETGVTAGPLTLVANVDSIHHDAEGRVRFHYTILDFAGCWVAGEPRPGDDVTEAEWADLADLSRYNLWSEAIRVIGLAQAAVSCGAAAGPETFAT